MIPAHPMCSVLVIAAGAGLVLCGCGKGQGRAGGAPAAGPHWNVEDACQTLSRPDVEGATGQKIRAAVTTAPTPGAQALVSSCAYELEGGALTVMTRVSKEDLTDGEIAEFNGAGGLMTKGEPMPGYGLAAFWSAQAHQLQIVPDRRHYAGVVYRAALTLPGRPAPPEPDAKTVTTTLAKKLL